MTMREEFLEWLADNAARIGMPDVGREHAGWVWDHELSAALIWQAAYAAGQRSGRIEERGACATTAAIHSMHPAQSSYEVGYGDGRKAAADAIRNRSNA